MKKLFIILFVIMLSLTGCNFITNNDNANQSLNMSADLNKTFTKIEGNLKNIDEIPAKITTSSNPENYPIKRVLEGDLVKFKQDLAYDPDGDKLIYSFSKPLDKKGEWQTKMGDAGEYIIEIIVSDGKLESSQKVMLIVDAINQVPVIKNFNDITVKEGETISLNPKVTDADGDSISLIYSGFMSSNTMKTDFSDAGEYEVKLTAFDGKQSTEKTITVTILNVNRAPTFTKINEKISVTEGDLVSIDYEVEDVDGDAVSVSFSSPLNSEGKWQTEVGDAGVYGITVIVSDGNLKESKNIELKVSRLNFAPELNVPKEIIVNEGEKIELNPEVSDADGDALKVTYSGFMTSSTYQTTYTDAGEYETKISVTDGIETVEKTVKIIIKDVNRPPVFSGDLFE